MREFKQISIATKANIYFDGAVTSRSVPAKSSFKLKVTKVCDYICSYID